MEPSEIDKRRLSLESIQLILSEADRIGSEKDDPEGSRVVTLSDTLVKRMLITINQYIEHGYEYLFKEE